MSGTVDLHRLLLAKQEILRAQLAAGTAHWHPNAKGDVGEINWEAVLEGRNGNSGFLPSRYAVSRAYIIDADGQRSDQIDLVIHDAYFCPLLFEQAGHRYIPAESVYAVFEVKPELNRDYVLYAAEKAASVRALRRTSLPIVHAGGTFKPRTPFPILAGILAATSGWSPPFGTALEIALNDADSAGRLDLGAVADSGAFDAGYTDGGRVELAVNSTEGGLMFFLTRLFTRLQQLGTVTAIDLSEYAPDLEVRPT